MAIQQWEDGVDLEIHGIGGYRTVWTTEDAALCLLERWPTGKGKAYMVAQRACLDGLAGRATADNVRQAFIKAAHEAKVHVRSTVDPRKAATRKSSESPGWRKANRDTMQAIEKSVTKIMAERERFFRGGKNSQE
jgi:hypothetical protein